VSDEKKSSGGFFAKVFGGVFALCTAVATPLIVKYSDRIFGTAGNAPPTTQAAPVKGPHQGGKSHPPTTHHKGPQEKKK
jgi:hypothetical protein